MTDIEFVDNFLNTFAVNITKQQKRKFHIGSMYRGYLWHLFSYELIPCLKGNEARAEYNKIDKTNALEIQYDNGILGDAETLPLEEAYRTAEGIDNDNLPEFYVIDKDFSWCYIVTHEFDLCGPYFCYKP